MFRDVRTCSIVKPHFSYLCWKYSHQTGKVSCCIQKSFERHHIRCQHKNVHTSNEEYRIVPNKHEEKHTTSEGRENDCDNNVIVIGEFTALISNVELDGNEKYDDSYIQGECQYRNDKGQGMKCKQTQILMYHVQTEALLSERAVLHFRSRIRRIVHEKKFVRIENKKYEQKFPQHSRNPSLRVRQSIEYQMSIDLYFVKQKIQKYLYM